MSMDTSFLLRHGAFYEYLESKEKIHVTFASLNKLIVFINPSYLKDSFSKLRYYAMCKSISNYGFISPCGELGSLYILFYHHIFVFHAKCVPSLQLKRQF